METISEIKNYKSFEQLKAEFFPQFVEKERNKQKENDIEKLAICLANKSFNDVLNKKNTSSKLSMAS
jgi:hypothetical protein